MNLRCEACRERIERLTAVRDEWCDSARDYADTLRHIAGFTTCERTREVCIEALCRNHQDTFEAGNPLHPGHGQ